jgi:hypothetical protein
MCLSKSGYRSKFVGMTAASAQSRNPFKGGVRSRFAAVLAILAIFGMLGLATWHDAMSHSHQAGGVVMLDDDHHEPASDHKPDAADLMHVAAHAVMQTVDLPSPPLLTSAMAPVVLVWALGLAVPAPSLAPLSILRPPKG